MTLAPERTATRAPAAVAFVAVVVASLAVSCAGLLVNPSPLDFEVYTSAGHALGHGASPRLLSGVPVLGVLTANAFVVGVALVAGARIAAAHRRRPHSARNSR